MFRIQRKMQNDYVCVPTNDTIFVRHESSCLRGCRIPDATYILPTARERTAEGTPDRSNSDKVRREGLPLGRPRQIVDGETKAINMASSRNCEQLTKLRRAKTALFGLDRERRNPEQRTTSGHKLGDTTNGISCIKGNSIRSLKLHLVVLRGTVYRINNRDG